MIDSHCHINDDLYINNPKEYIEEANNAGVETLLIVGFDYKSSLGAVKIAESFDNVYAAVGIHPSEVKKIGKDDLDKLELLISSKKVIAIGEIGLDYYWDHDENVKKEQREYFIKQINLANKHNLPICVHCRDAYGETLDILKNNKVNKAGIIHCFGSSIEMANEFIKLGFLIGLGGTVTFKNAVTPKDVASKVDRSSYVLETDAPYLAPTPHRGKPNHSKYLGLVRDEISLLKNLSRDDVENDTTSNFKRVFLNEKAV